MISLDERARLACAAADALRGILDNAGVSDSLNTTDWLAMLSMATALHRTCGMHLNTLRDAIAESQTSGEIPS